MTTFTGLTSIPIYLTQEGEEPPLSPATKGLFFSIIHNSLTNVLRHSQATNVSISLVFGAEGISLTILDNGIGLPEDYSQRGEGILSMLDSAEQMGGQLEVSSSLSEQGTTVACWLPNTFEQGGRKVV
jgi:signal transduction histidine kinase